MPKPTDPEEVFNELMKDGSYEEAHLDKEEVRKVLTMAMEDYAFGKKLRRMENPSWRVIFHIHYDVLRELCDQLMRFHQQKISNHQGLFVSIVLKEKRLELDWNFLETIRTIRNRNKYQGLDILGRTWRDIDLQFDLYISALKNEIEKSLNESE
ncbi:hypothetical protein HY772_08790 [Candidatus Woesearchaeota archaeon]|nr:hypothetical protein [Candidatus Woesearchaeota archaeon]